MDWYIVIKTINGRRYRYRQKTRRVGKRVRTKSEYISPEVIIGYHGTFAKFERFSYEHAGSPRMRQQERALIRREVVCSGRGAFEPGDFGGAPGSASQSYAVQTHLRKMVRWLLIVLRESPFLRACALYCSIL